MSFAITIAGSSARFSARGDETLLDAADRAGLARPWRCADGSCGSCRTVLVQGECLRADGSLVRAGSHGSPEPSILPCRARPRSDLHLRPRAEPPLRDLASCALRMEVLGMHPLSARVLRVELAPVGDTLTWLPGQYLELVVDGMAPRAFSIANAPRDDGRIELHVRHAGDGPFSRWVAERLAIGMQLQAEGPLGSFVPHEDAARGLVLVAGGTGMAPIKAMIEHFVQLGARRDVQLYWGVRTPAGLYLETQLQRWVARLPWFDFVPVISDPDGTLPAGMRHGLVVDALRADHTRLADRDVYVCGPPAMVATATGALRAAMAPARLFSENARHAPARLAGVLAQRAGLRTP